jgi:aminopeptidase YwaD
MKLELGALLCLLSTGPAGSSDRIQADVARLAGDEWQGRRAGTEGADRAAEWIAASFRSAGLEPGGEGGSFFQPFTFIDGVNLGTGNRLQTSAGDARRSFEAGVAFRPLAFSSAGSASGEVVFAGYGIAAKDLGYDDYEGANVKDRVVLVLRYGPDGSDPQSRWAAFSALRFKAATARERGASALLVVTGPRTKDANDELVPLRADASLVDAGLPCFSVTRAVAESLGADLDALQKAVDEGGKPAPVLLAKAHAELVADVEPRRSTTRNVVGLLPGRDPSAGVVVVGAHYDHLGLGMSGSLDPAPEGKIHHGADDNASGVAGLLELARRLRSRPLRLERSVAFLAFGAEEEGTLGSSHFVKSPTLPTASITAMLNMDMIGRLREDTLQVHGVGSSPAFPALLEEAARSGGLKLKTREGGYGPSDHSPFYAAGRPVLFFFTGAHSDYHRPSDTADKIDADGISRVVSVVESVVAGLGQSSGSVAFIRVAADKEMSTEGSAAAGLRVWVGGIPDYSDESAGVRLSGVTPGSPAEKAGLQAGDVIVRFGAKEIRNIYDYTYALQERKPGERVTVMVKRGGTEMSLEVILGTRSAGAR